MNSAPNPGTRMQAGSVRHAAGLGAGNDGLAGEGESGCVMVGHLRQTVRVDTPCQSVLS